MQVKHPVTDWGKVPIVMDIPYAARIMGKTPDNLYKRARNGDFPAVRDGDEWRVNKEDLRAYLGLDPTPENKIEALAEALVRALQRVRAEQEDAP